VKKKVSVENLIFTSRVGTEKKQVPFPAAPSLDFLDVIEEVCRKFGVSMQTVTVATPSGIVLTASDMNKTVSNVVKENGISYEIIDQGDVGGF